MDSRAKQTWVRNLSLTCMTLVMLLSFSEFPYLQKWDPPHPCALVLGDQYPWSHTYYLITLHL